MPAGFPDLNMQLSLLALISPTASTSMISDLKDSAKANA